VIFRFLPTRGYRSWQLAREDSGFKFMLTPQELRKIDDWRFMQRMPSRSAALRALLKLGLASQRIVAPFASGSQDFSEDASEK
jgi:hypothetical protein